MFGVMASCSPVMYHKGGFQYDMGAFRWPFAICALLAGGGGMLLGVFGKRRADGGTLMCPVCEKAFEEAGPGSAKCPRCDVELEPLHGFYDRHPELKN